MEGEAMSHTKALLYVAAIWIFGLGATWVLQNASEPVLYGIGAAVLSAWWYFILRIGGR